MSEEFIDCAVGGGCLDVRSARLNFFYITAVCVSKDACLRKPYRPKTSNQAATRSSHTQHTMKWSELYQCKDSGCCRGCLNRFKRKGDHD